MGWPIFIAVMTLHGILCFAVCENCNSMFVEFPLVFRYSHSLKSQETSFIRARRIASGSIFLVKSHANSLPNKDEILNQCRFNVGLSSTTLGQYIVVYNVSQPKSCFQEVMTTLFSVFRCLKTEIRWRNPRHLKRQVLVIIHLYFVSLEINH